MTCRGDVVSGFPSTTDTAHNKTWGTKGHAPCLPSSQGVAAVHRKNCEPAQCTESLCSCPVASNLAVGTQPQVCIQQDAALLTEVSDLGTKTLTIRPWPRICHTQDAWACVLQLEVLIRKHCPVYGLPACPIACCKVPVTSKTQHVIERRMSALVVHCMRQLILLALGNVAAQLW